MKSIIVKFVATMALFATAPIFIAFGQQQITGKVESTSYNKAPMDIVLFMFGMDDPVKVGNVDNNGNISLSFPSELPGNIPSDIKEMFLVSLTDAFHFSCLDRSIFSDDVLQATAYRGGYLSLSTVDEPWVGGLLPVSDTLLTEWLEDPHYNSPIISSFYEVVYSNQDINFTTICKADISHAEKQVPVEYHYSLQLKQGFNVIEYKIESIFSNVSEEYPSVPSVVTITNLGDSGEIKWVGKYFY